MKRACGSCQEYDRETNSLPERCLIFVKKCSRIVAAEEVECEKLDLDNLCKRRYTITLRKAVQSYWRGELLPTKQLRTFIGPNLSLGRIGYFAR